uniref:density-regulated protein-like n=1 Tax=Styela clava TaxID=7725 RepID=UPI0019399D10|nr:density-regulated protein-like [Styela clava]
MSDEEAETSEPEIERQAEKKVIYPLKVFYCPECTLPLEYCEFMPEATRQRCKDWRDNNNDLLIAEGIDMEKLSLEETSGEKKRQKRGGRGNVKAKQKKEPDKVRIAKIPRGKKKFVTRVQGLGTFDVNLKKASKLFAQKFSCGSSVSGPDEIIIQGDCTDELFDLIPETWNEIEEDHIEDLGEVKR